MCVCVVSKSFSEKTCDPYMALSGREQRNQLWKTQQRQQHPYLINSPFFWKYKCNFSQEIFLDRSNCTFISNICPALFTLHIHLLRQPSSCFLLELSILPLPFPAFFIFSFLAVTIPPATPHLLRSPSLSSL